MTTTELSHAKPGGKRIRPTKKQQQDESIMDTNNSCIVSKRSVEKIYHQQDNGFLRYFVKKFQRRSPLINRGYWLRMRAIEHVVKTFLQENSGKRKAVVNLGCGYDPLPFKFLSEEEVLCQNSLFVDVDYKLLMTKKCDMIRNTPELRTVLANPMYSSQDNDVLLSSDQYKAVACDLEDVQNLNRIFKKLFDDEDTPVMFLAEVSMTYMDATAAEKVITWASDLKNARFCILEQFLPDGPSHPFAETMLKHFNKLNSPLKSAMKYPSLEDQKRRFSNFGWPQVNVRSLWDLWSEDDGFLSSSERAALDRIEPFDEWEEFALFAGHYFLLVADNQCSDVGDRPLAVKQENRSGEDSDGHGATRLAAICTAYPNGQGCRRFGATFMGDVTMLCHHGGHGTQGRLKTSEVFSKTHEDEKSTTQTESTTWSSRDDIMCHTITTFAVDKHLLVGGRRSPDSASSFCLVGYNGRWTEVQPLPHGLFRHCAVAIESSEGRPQFRTVLMFGGKSGSGEIRDDWLCWEQSSGWRTLEVVGERPCPRFGACLATFGSDTNKGLLTGGLSQDGKVLSDAWLWEVVHEDHITIRCTNITDKLKFKDTDSSIFGRFGAVIIPSPSNLPAGYFLVGGISGPRFLTRENEILHVSVDLEVSRISVEPVTPRPLLVGCSIESTNAETFTIVGGGAVCFSFGTCWNEGSYTVGKFSSSDGQQLWHLHQQPKTEVQKKPKSQSVETKEHGRISFRPGSRLRARNGRSGLGAEGKPSVGEVIEKAQIPDAAAFEAIIRNSRPAILRGFDIGQCTELWKIDYLKQQIGEERQVVVHSATSQSMNFLEKNFAYDKLPFGEFLDKVESGEKLYLRALSSNKPADKVTNLAEDFPSISHDFDLPPQMMYAKDHLHSSPLRISGPVTMWLHYDVMANVLCQIRGEKQVILFPPTDVKHLDFPPGASSSRTNIFNDANGKTNQVASTHPILFTLKPGDILFIPALWPHTAQPSTGLSIAVNVFFRSLEDGGYSAGKDVYGNRDVQAYENGRRDVQKMVKAFQKLPAEMGRFYLDRLAGELAEVAERWS